MVKHVNDRFSQYVLSSICKFFNSESPEYFNEIYFPAEPSNINIQSSFQRLKQPFRKWNKGLNRYGTNCQLKLKGQEA